MRNSILDDLDELLSQQVITEEDASRIRNYYDRKPQPPNNRLVIIFGVLGSLLVGMGIILILAHNWDNLPKFIKLAVALLPLLAGQALCGYLLEKKSASIAWREGASVFVMFAIATAISIVSQVYHIEGNFGNFLFVWMLLTLPVIYVMQSSAVSLLFWMGITWYACEDGYFQFHSGIVYKYWLLALAAVPFYWQRCKTAIHSNNTNLHHWIVAISLTIVLGTFTEDAWELIMPAYIFLFGVFILFAQTSMFQETRLFANAYLILGSFGSVVLLLSLSFDWYWDYIAHQTFDDWPGSSELLVCLLLLGVSVLLFVMLNKRTGAKTLISKSYVVPVFLMLFLLGVNNPASTQVLVNIFILVLAIYTIREGSQADHLGRMNYGLVILTLLIICRFFDTDLTFVVRGLLFVIVGLGFFALNYRMIKKRRDQQP